MIIRGPYELEDEPLDPDLDIYMRVIVSSAKGIEVVWSKYC